MNKETEIVILESLRILLWENHRKWETINLQNGGGGCVETNEIEELVGRIIDILNPTKEPTLAEKTKDALSEELNNTEKSLEEEDEI